MKRTFLQICTASAVLAISLTGCGPSEKDIAEKKQLEVKVTELSAKVTELENELQEVTVVENTKTAIEEVLKKEAPPNSTIKCTSVVLMEKKGQNEWLAEGEVLCVIPNIPPQLNGITGIRVIYNPDNKSVKADFSKVKPKRGARELEIQCSSNLKQLALLLKEYAIDHDDRFPADVNKAKELFKSEAVNIHLCPADRKIYTYIPGLRDSSNPNFTLVYCKYHSKNGEFLQAKVDGSAGYGKIIRSEKDLKNSNTPSSSAPTTSNKTETKTKMSAYDQMICSKAKERMTDFLATMDGSKAPTCASVTIVKKVSKTKWIGKATTSNGKSGEITISILAFGDDDSDPALMVMPVDITDFHNPF